MSKRIVKDGKFCIANGRFVTDAGGAPCVCGGGSNCPAPCVVVILSGLHYVMGGIDHPCYIAGGTVCQSVAGTEGAFVLPLGPDGYSATFPVSLTTIQAEGISSQYTTRIGGRMRVTAQLGECENGVIQGFLSVGAAVSQFAIDSQGGVDPGPFFSGVFSGGSTDGQPVPLGASVANTNVVVDGCVANNVLDIVFGGSATVIQPAECTLPPVYYYAAKCTDPQDRIIIDIYTIPEGGAASCLYNGELYRPTPDIADGSPVAVEWVNDLCAITEYGIANACDDSVPPIVFDPAQRPPDGVTMLYQGVRYIPTTLTTQESPVGVTWSPDDCPSPTNARYAELCTDRSQRITYDRAIAQSVPGARSCLYQNQRYDLTAIESPDAPVSVSFSTRACFGVVNPCDSLPPNGDDRCNLPQFRSCPQCNGYVGIDPQPEPTQERLANDEEPGFGDAVASAIEFVTRGVFEGCSGCARRKAILNKFGNRLGWKVIRFKGW